MAAGLQSGGLGPSVEEWLLNPALGQTEAKLKIIACFFFPFLFWWVSCRPRRLQIPYAARANFKLLIFVPLLPESITTSSL